MKLKQIRLTFVHHSIIAVILGSCGPVVTSSKTNSHTETSSVIMNGDTVSKTIVSDTRIQTPGIADEVMEAAVFTDEWWNRGSQSLDKYKDQIVQLRGVLAKNATEDKLYLQGSADSKLYVVCNAKEGTDFSSLEKGAVVTVTGVCLGMSMNVDMKECELIEQ